jgi:hypothetical protein
MRCRAIGRLLNSSRRCVAAWGVLRESKNAPCVYWVSVETDPYLFFNNKEQAKTFYEEACARLRSRPRRFTAEHKRTLAVLAGA